MGKVALVIGATGLVGHQLVLQLLDDDRFGEVRIFVRRSYGRVHPKLKEYIIDFDKTESWQSLVFGDVLFSCMGTTLKVAGSKENQYKVDFTYQYRFAEIASKNGVAGIVLVSSAGADARSSFFYPRIKGELDDAIARLPFDSVTILRPSLLDGNREGKRIAEQISLFVGRFVFQFIFRKYRPIRDQIVARAMICAAVDSSSKRNIVALAEIFELAAQKR